MTQVHDITIRPYELDDATDLFEAVRESMAELRPWMPWCHSGYAIAESQSWLAAQAPAYAAGTTFEFAIISGDGRYLGGCGLNQINKTNQWANLGYWVRTSAARRGVATAAARLLRDWAFAKTDLIRLEILAASGNVGSQRVAEKAGATREGLLRRRLLLYGVPHDAAVFSFIRPGWDRAG